MPRQEQGIEYYLITGGEKRYRVHWREQGRQRSRSFRTLSGENGARRFYLHVREAQEAGSHVALASARQLTLAVFVADVWAPRAQRRLAEPTWKRDSAIYNKHILHQLGARPISRIDTEDLVEWQEERERAKVGRGALIKAISILSSIFREAARRSRSTGVSGNPVAALDKPAAKHRRRPLVWGPIVVERVRYELLVNSRRVGENKELAALRDALLVSFMEITGCRPGEALALHWRDVEERAEFTKALSGDQIVPRTKTGRDRVAPILAPLAADLAALRAAGEDRPADFVFSKPSGGHWLQTDWRNYRSRHFATALKRVEDDWERWHGQLAEPKKVRESVAGLHRTRPYDLGRHTHSSLMLAAGMSLQRLARIHGHSIRVLDETYSEELAEYEERVERIDPVDEIESARRLVWGHRNPSTPAK